jgi:hypothetical protein
MTREKPKDNKLYIVLHLLNSGTIRSIGSFGSTNGHVSNKLSNGSCHNVGHANIQPAFPLLHGVANKIYLTIKQQKLTNIQL